MGIGCFMGIYMNIPSGVLSSAQLKQLDDLRILRTEPVSEASGLAD